MHIDKICIIIYYYSPTCSGRFCNDHPLSYKNTNNGVF